MNTVFGELSKKISKESKRGGSLNTDSILSNIFQIDSINEWILNTIQTRIYTTGKDSENNILQTDRARAQGNSYYSNYTQNVKRSKGQKINNVTLYDSGDFYKSWKFNVGKSYYKLTAKFNKNRNKISDNFSIYSEKDFENAILSLSDSENNILNKKLLLPEMLSLMKFELDKLITQSK